MKTSELPYADGDFLLERMEGKGGWTYIVIPKTVIHPGVPFGWLKVTGSIDDYELGQIKLMPMKGGNLFLPVKAAIRKQLKKEAGDTVHVLLYPDYLPYGVPAELVECLEMEPLAYERFQQQTESVQKQAVDWIYNARTEETKVARIAATIERLLKASA